MFQPTELFGVHIVNSLPTLVCFCLRSSSVVPLPVVSSSSSSSASHATTPHPAPSLNLPQNSFLKIKCAFYIFIEISYENTDWDSTLFFPGVLIHPSTPFVPLLNQSKESALMSLSLHNYSLRDSLTPCHCSVHCVYSIPTSTSLLTCQRRKQDDPDLFLGCLRNSVTLSAFLNSAFLNLCYGKLFLNLLQMNVKL